MRDQLIEAISKDDACKVRDLLEQDSSLTDITFTEDGFLLTLRRVAANTVWYTQRTVGYTAAGTTAAVTVGSGLTFQPGLAVVGSAATAGLFQAATAGSGWLGRHTFNQNGWTPLFFAAAANAGCAAVELIHSRHFSLRDNGVLHKVNGQTFLDIARACRHDDFVRCCEQAMVHALGWQIEVAELEERCTEILAAYDRSQRIGVYTGLLRNAGEMLYTISCFTFRSAGMLIRGTGWVLSELFSACAACTREETPAQPEKEGCSIM